MNFGFSKIGKQDVNERGASSETLSSNQIRLRSHRVVGVCLREPSQE
jgi:hypothetical protein